MAICFRGNKFQQTSLLVCIIALTLLTNSSLQAQRKIAADRLAVDVVSVRKLGRLHGIVLSQGPKTLKIAVRKDWLAKKLPEFSDQHFQDEAETLVQGQNLIRQRLEDWKKERAGEDDLAVQQFIDRNVRTLKLDQAIDPNKFTFTIVELETAKVGRVFTKSEAKHLIAAIAWLEEIPDVEERSSAFLKREIESRKIDISTYDVNLADQLPGLLESDQEWEVRKGIVEFMLLPRLEYHGIGTVFYRKSESANPLAIMQQMRGGSFSQLSDLGKDLGLPEFQDRRNDLDGRAWLQRMIKTAESESRRCFTVSSLTQGETVTVETTLYIKAAKAKWCPLKKFKATEKLAEQNSDAIKRVMDDPQVEDVMKMAKQMGLSDAGVMDKAMRSGAATRNALRTVSQELESFVAPYSFDVDLPPVPTPIRR